MGWFAEQNRLSIRERLARFGCNVVDVCVFCGNSSEAGIMCCCNVPLPDRFGFLFSKERLFDDAPREQPAFGYWWLKSMVGKGFKAKFRRVCFTTVVDMIWKENSRGFRREEAEVG